ncbi:phthiocerol/phenolphthiocerol synthesis type-I polyketide synthase E [Thermoflexales bacterium]|nr:phthiocerol/phenolphthiocerol synthesis type-I polyketide synthase E [Thermoflexales bacterium]
MMDAVMSNATGLEIAVIGMAGRFPGAGNIQDFWRNLRDGVESISFFSDQELSAQGVDSALLQDVHYIKARGILDDIDHFDAPLFGFSPREAEIMDPQHRLFLQCAWEALEHAGYDPETYAGLIGVYAGVSASTYLLNNLAVNHELMQAVGGYQVMIGNDKDYLTTRASYKLNLEGPSLTLQTACSTSLVATHLACQGLLSGNCDIALAGGASLRVPQKSGYLYQEGGIFSRDGHCRAFDAQAQGTVGGDGVGIVVLKRLADALADRDFIHAIIKGSAINNDGSLKVGYTAPRVDGQARVIRAAQIMAEVDPDTITFIEAHGTGTPLGDPIEIAALTQAFHETTSRIGYCAMGSVKTNIGHLDAAAGVAGLIKAILSLEHQQIPPSLNFEQPNPQIDFAHSPFYVNTRLAEWKANGTPRRAGVSSFGIGGTNAHVVLEEAPAIESSPESRPGQLLTLSAASHAALEKATTNLVEYLKQDSGHALADVAYTLQLGRRALNHRRMLVAHDQADALQALEICDPKRVFTSFQEPGHRPVAFMFPGQGAQQVNMALELYQNEPLFREDVDRCARILQPHLGLDLRSALYPNETQREEAAQQLQQTWLTQPALFAIEYAVARLWMAWGVPPQAMIGHSLGEYVAACLAQVFSLEDALLLVAARGRLMQELPRGAMLSVHLAEQELRSRLATNLSVAAINAPALTVVSGPPDAIELLEHQLSAQGVDCRRLHTSHAFHSEMMEPILKPFLSHVKRVTLRPPEIPYLSNVTGTWIKAAEATDPDYWVQHLRRPVRFADDLQALLERTQVLLEVGPGQTLTTLAKQHPAQAAKPIVLASLPRSQDRQSDRAYLLHTLGRLWLAGVSIDWPGFYASEKRRRIPLPAYPFEAQRYWIDPPSSSKQPGRSAPAAPPQKADPADWFYVPFWKPAALPASLKSEAKPTASWLVFTDACGLGQQVAAGLTQRGQNVVQVQPGSGFARLADDQYQINPRQREDYAALCSELNTRGKLPRKIVHLWGVIPSELSRARDELFEETQYTGFCSLLFLAQALGHQPLMDTLDLWVVTDQAQAVSDERELHPERATALGACKVIAQEYPQIVCRSIDVVAPIPRPQHVQKLVESLLNEINAHSAEAVVAYRAGQRWVQTFEPIHLNVEAETIHPLREQGVYLAVGALNGVGYALIESIAQATRCTLILLEEAVFPPKEEWHAWLCSRGEEDGVSRKIRKAQALEAWATEVLVIGASLNDPEQLRTVLSTIETRYGPPHGVIYAASLADEYPARAIEETDQKEYLQSAQSKIFDLLAFEEALQERPLDFCFLQSSLSAVLGGLGAVSDAAIQVFMGAFAQRHNRTQLVPWTSLHWDLWKFRDEKGAMPGASLVELAITPETGPEAFRRVLRAGSFPQVIISTSSLQARLDQWIKPDARRVPQPVGAPVGGSRHPRPDLPTAYTAPANEIERSLSELWQELLGVEPIGRYDNFFELGGHSLLATQVMSRLRQSFQVELPLRTIFEAAAIADLALAIAQKQLEQADREKVLHLLAEIKQLSPDKVQTELAMSRDGQ